MTTKEALIRFYRFNRLNFVDDLKSHCVRVYIGCILAPVPNIKARKKYLRFCEFCGYVFLSLLIHIFMLITGKAMLILEWVRSLFLRR